MATKIKITTKTAYENTSGKIVDAKKGETVEAADYAAEYLVKLGKAELAEKPAKK
jgi:hypothetical protein